MHTTHTTHTTVFSTRRQNLKVLSGLGLGVAAASLPWTANAQTRVQGVTAAEIRLGQTAALTGALNLANLQANAAARAVFDAVNIKGGVHGRKITFVSLDDAYLPAKGLENFKELNDPVTGVFSLFLTGGTPVNMALLPGIEESRIPNIAPLAAADSLHKPELKMFFHIRASYGQELEKMASYLVTQGIKNVAVIYSDNTFGKSGLALFEQVSATVGLKVVGRVLTPDKIDNASALTDQVKQSGCQAVIGLSSAIAALGWAKSELPKLGVPFLTISLLGTAGAIKFLGDSATGVVVAQAVPNYASRKFPISNEYTTLMGKAGVTNLGFAGMEGFIAAHVVVEALQRAGKTLTRDAFLGALGARKFDLRGYEVNFTGGKRSGSKFVELSLVTAGGRFAQ